MNAGPSALITDVTVDLDISHTWVGDLAVSLVAPSGTSVTLFAGSCGTSDDVLATFTDAGAPFACGGTPVIAGDVQPQSPFAGLAGEAASGTWTLTVADNAGGDPTNINNINLTVNYSATPLQLHSTLYYLLLCESSFFVLFPFLPCFAAVELMGSETFLDYSRLHVGSVLPRDILVPRVKNFVGYVSQLKFNGVDYFDRYLF